jgi:hypothetical protein
MMLENFGILILVSLNCFIYREPEDQLDNYNDGLRGEVQELFVSSSENISADFYAISI